jgi:ATP-dependent Lhr-like helicase
VGGVTGHTLLSKRALTRLQELRAEFAFLTPDSTTLVRAHDGMQVWWTFAGGAANAVLAAALSSVTLEVVGNVNDLSLRLRGSVSIDREQLQKALVTARPAREVSDQLASELKFSSCLSANLLGRCIDARILDREGAAAILQSPITVLHAAATSV